MKYEMHITLAPCDSMTRAAGRNRSCHRKSFFGVAQENVGLASSDQMHAQLLFLQITANESAHESANETIEKDL